MEGPRPLHELLHRITQLLQAISDVITSGLAFLKGDINPPPVNCLLACLFDDIPKGLQQHQGSVNPFSDVFLMAGKDQELQALNETLAMLKLEGVLSRQLHAEHIRGY